MNQFKAVLIRFRSDEKGVFAVVFGVLAVVLVAISGAVVDYVGVQNAKGTAQAALDSATFALKREIGNKTEAQIELLAEGLLNERMASLGLKINVETVNADPANDSLFIQARFAVPTFFLTLVGIDELQARIHSQVTSSSISTEVALVLDSTSSMSGAKLSALKSASILLVNELMPNPVTPKMRIAVVPFNRYVNIGVGNRNEPGLDIPADYSASTSAQSCSTTYPNSTRKCSYRPQTYNCPKGGVMVTCVRQVAYNCTGSYGAPVSTCQPATLQNYNWYGCMGSRHLTGLDTRDDNYRTTGVPGIVRIRNTCDVTAMTELTSTRSDVLGGINAMQAQDKTYIPTGLMWGWRVLSPGIPFTKAAPYGNANKKVLILLTDGENTASPDTVITPHDPQHRVHTGSNAKEANAKTASICNNVRDEGVVVYTIAFDVTDATIRTILDNCAGNGGSYFDVSDAAQLKQAFSDIAEQLRPLRLVQ